MCIRDRAQPVQYAAAQVQSQPGGMLLFPAVAAGKPLFKNSGQVLGANANAAILKKERAPLQAQGNAPTLRRIFDLSLIHI